MADESKQKTIDLLVPSDISDQSKTVWERGSPPPPNLPLCFLQQNVIWLSEPPRTGPAPFVKNITQRLKWMPHLISLHFEGVFTSWSDLQVSPFFKWWDFLAQVVASSCCA